MSDEAEFLLVIGGLTGEALSSLDPEIVEWCEEFLLPGWAYKSYWMCFGGVTLRGRLFEEQLPFPAISFVTLNDMVAFRLRWPEITADQPPRNLFDESSPPDDSRETGAC